MLGTPELSGIVPGSLIWLQVLIEATAAKK